MTDEELTKLMQMYAEDAVGIAKKQFGVTLDYSEQSILTVDEILDKMTGGGIISPASLSPEDEESLWLHCKAYGGYVGEVIVRHIGAVWKARSSDDDSATIELLIADRLKASPPQKIWKRLTESNLDRTLGYYRGLQHILGKQLFVPAGFPESQKPSEPDRPAACPRKSWWKIW
jgi:hypothetical protein